MKTSALTLLALHLALASTTILQITANDIQEVADQRQDITLHHAGHSSRDTRYKGSGPQHAHRATPAPNNQKAKTASPTPYYLRGKNQKDSEDTDLLWYTLAFIVVVLPPAAFVCIYSPGECLVAIGIGMILIGGILHNIHNMDPTHSKIPWHTSPYLYVISGFFWILAGLWKMYVQTISREIEREEAEERRIKYSVRRTEWEQDASRERRRRDRERRKKYQQKRIAKRLPFALNGSRNYSEYEMVPLSHRRQGRESAGDSWDDEDDDDDLNSLHTV